MKGINFFVADSQPASEELQALTVNRDALTTRDGVKVVFLVENNHVTEAAVTPGRELGDVVEILNGLTAGQLAVLNPPGKMQSGQKVEITR